MPNNSQETIHEVLIVPLPALLAQTALAVAEAQITLDEMSMRVQQQLDLISAQARALAGEEPAGLARFQVDASWYHIPEVELKLKMSLTMQVRQQVDGQGRKVYRPTLLSVPHNSRSRTLTNFEAEGTSAITARIVSIPASERTT